MNRKTLLASLLALASVSAFSGERDTASLNLVEFWHSGALPQARELTQLLNTKDGKILFGEGSDNVEALLRENPGAARLAEVAIKIARAAARCLQHDLCGEKAEGERAYFDPDHTPSHQLLAQGLRAAQVGEQLGLVNSSSYPENELLQNMQFQNSEIQLLSTELLLQTPQPEVAAKRLLDSIEKLVPEVKPSVYGIFTSRFPAGTPVHDRAVSKAAQELESGSGHTRMEILRKLSLLALNPTELARFTASLCSANVRNPGSWRAGSGYLKKYGTAHGFDGDPMQACPGASLLSH